jgi:hypothetical protein
MHADVPNDTGSLTQRTGRTSAGVLARKLSQLIPLSEAKRANPRYFVLLCGIICDSAGRVHRPIVDSESTIAG